MATTSLVKPPAQCEIVSLSRKELTTALQMLDKHCSAVCQIIIRDRPHLKGTGVLIGGNLLLTNHHVIPNEGVARKAFARFRQVASEIPAHDPIQTVTPIDLDPDHYFLSHPNKEKTLFGQPIPEPADRNHLDFTIVALKSHPYLASAQQKTYSLFKENIYQQGNSIYAIHFPDINELRGAEISPWKLRKITTYSVHYGPIAGPGSSGAGVINETGLIALHYQTVPNCSEDCKGTRPCFAGVRIDKIAEYLNRTGGRQQIETLIEQYKKDSDTLIKAHIAEFHRTRETSSLFNGNNGEEWLFRLDDIYTDLVVIGESERDDEKKQKKEAKFHDRRIPTHETLHQPKTPIPIKELFNQDKLKTSVKKRAIIYGAAGVGKTTFSEMIAIHGPELWPDQFEVVFLIKLRNFNKKDYHNRLDWSTAEILAKEHGISINVSTIASSSSSSSNPNTSFAELQEFLKCESFKSNALLILDGFDELSFKVLHGEKWNLKNVIQSFEQTFDHILITSRPGTVRFPGINIKSQAEFEITGFDDKSIEIYIRKFYARLSEKGEMPEGATPEEKIDKLLALLAKQPILRSLAQIPINLTLTCSIFCWNEEVFNSAAAFSLTRFYILSVEWLYRRFFHRPNAPALGDDADPLDISLLQDLDKALQLIAWKALEIDRILITDQQRKDALKGQAFHSPNQVDISNLQALGLIKFENETGKVSSSTSKLSMDMKYWEFIHLTFQEYFGAVYLANLFLDNKPEAKTILSKIKFDPKYNLVLQMAVGYLSNKENHDVLQAFFDCLFDEPRDLARSYKLMLFASCFEECKDPEGISQYSSFKIDCTHYINTAVSESAIFGLLNRNTKLLDQKDILSAIQSEAANPNRSLQIVSVLYDMSRKKHVLPASLTETLLLPLTHPSSDRLTRITAAKTIETIVQNEGTVSERCDP